MKIWQKYLFKKALLAFLFFFFCLIAIFIVVDFSVHGLRFLSSQTTSVVDIILYYARIFATLLDLFLPLSFLLASLKVLLDLSGKGELVALQMAGLSKKRLLIPFFAIASGLSLFSYINAEYFAPDAQDLTSAFMSAHKPPKKENRDAQLFSISLADNSNLIYHYYETNQRTLYDVFWIRAPDDIWHMKSLQTDELKGSFVDHLIRNEVHQLEKTDSFAEKIFEELPLNPKILLQKFVPYDNRPLFTLFVQALGVSADKPRILSHLYYKLLVPLTSLLIPLIIGPIAMRFARHRPQLLITASCLFGFISLKVVWDGMLVLGENQVLPPIVAMMGPIGFVLLFAVPQFAKTQ